MEIFDLQGACKLCSTDFSKSRLKTGNQRVFAKASWLDCEKQIYEIVLPPPPSPMPWTIQPHLVRNSHIVAEIKDRKLAEVEHLKLFHKRYEHFPVGFFVSPEVRVRKTRHTGLGCNATCTTLYFMWHWATSVLCTANSYWVHLHQQKPLRCPLYSNKMTREMYRKYNKSRTTLVSSTRENGTDSICPQHLV